MFTKQSGPDGFIFSPTSSIDCCNVNAMGYECKSTVMPVPSPTDDFGSFEAYQTVFLVISNLFLLIPALKAFFMKNYSRFALNVFAMFASMFYHACKTKVFGGGICFLNFCALKNLDYSFSNTVLVSLIFFIFPFVIQEKMEDEDNEDDGYNEKKPKLIKKYRFIEDIILCIYPFSIYITLDSTIFCNGSNTMLLFLVIAGSGFTITIIGHCIIVRIVDVKAYAPYNKTNLIIGFGFAILAIALFVIEDYVDKRLYWLIHSLWHIFASLAQSFLLDARNKRIACYSLCFCCMKRVKFI